MLKRLAILSVLVACTGNLAAAPTTQWAADAALLERARAIHQSVPLIDGHNDLPWMLRNRARGDLSQMDIRGPLPDLHTDIPRLKQGGVGGLFFSAYVPYSAYERKMAARMTIEQIDLIHRMVAFAPETFEFATTADDVERIHRAGKIAAMIGVEGGHSIENSLALLRQFHTLGVRYMTLTHSESLDWADSAGDPNPRLGGLTPFGEEVVREMNRLGMLVDLSHVSDDAMRDALRVTEAPVIFSHSSARALAGNQPRDVPDDVLPLVRENGGVVMVNFFSGFLLPEPVGRRERLNAVRRQLQEQYPGEANDDARRAAMRAWTQANPVPRGDVGTVADHIDHLVKVAGIDHVGLGSDFDGVGTLPDGLDDVSKYPNLTAELLRRGYSETDVKKILGLNVLRVMRAVEATARRLSDRPPSMATIVPAELMSDNATTRPAR